jgi:hypothetical protein
MLFKQGHELRFPDKSCGRLDLMKDENVSDAVHVEGPRIKVPLNVTGHGSCWHGGKNIGVSCCHRFNSWWCLGMCGWT